MMITTLYFCDKQYLGWIKSFSFYKPINNKLFLKCSLFGLVRTSYIIRRGGGATSSPSTSSRWANSGWMCSGAHLNHFRWLLLQNFFFFLSRAYYMWRYIFKLLALREKNPLRGREIEGKVEWEFRESVICMEEKCV